MALNKSKTKATSKDIHYNAHRGEQQLKPLLHREEINLRDTALPGYALIPCTYTGNIEIKGDKRHQRLMQPDVVLQTVLKRKSKMKRKSVHMLDFNFPNLKPLQKVRFSPPTCLITHPESDENVTRTFRVTVRVNISAGTQDTRYAYHSSSRSPRADAPHRTRSTANASEEDMYTEACVKH